MKKQLDSRIENALPAWERATQTEVVRLQTTPERVSKSFLGGTAESVPVDETGTPMQLLCTLYCSEIKGIPDFPEKGVLQFFIGQAPMYGMDPSCPTVQKNWKVLYDPYEPDMLPETMQDLQTQHPVKGCFCLRPSPEMECLAPPDYRFRSEFERFLRGYGRKEPIDWDEYDILMERYRLGGSKIGGYVWSTQDDPRERNELQKYDTVLLQVDSVYQGECQISFGDAGVALFLIPKEKLKMRDFSDVLFWWDCY